jgi:acetyl-CoA carboxylase alpha subunit
MEFLVTAEKFGAASSTGIDTAGFGVGVFTHERGFSAALAQHSILLIGETITPWILWSSH